MPRAVPGFGTDEPTEEAPTSEAQAMIIAPEETPGELALRRSRPGRSMTPTSSTGRSGGRRRYAHETHGWASDRLADRLGISGIILVTLDISCISRNSI